MESQEETLRNVESARASTAADRISGDILSTTGRAKSDIAEAAETAKAEARRIASQQKDVGADRLGDVAGAVRGAARSLESGMPQMASYVHDAAVRLEDAARTLRQRNIDDLLAEVGRFARSQPALFVGGAMLAGFALTRFLKSSAPSGAARSSVTPNTGNRWPQPEAEGPR
jgi:ABC-type transporter Mla subunit MlaD